MKNLGLAILALLALFLLQAPVFAGEEQESPGWTSAEMAEAAEGCTSHLLRTNVEAYRRKGARKGVVVSKEELEVARSFMAPLIRPYCLCIFLELNKEYGKKGVPITELMQEKPEALKEIIEKATCERPLPNREQAEEMKRQVEAIRAKQAGN